MANYNNYAFIDGQNLHKTIEELEWYFCYFKFVDTRSDYQYLS